MIPIYIKLPKTFIENNANTKDKKILILAYLFFHTTFDKEIYTSIDCICEELNLSTKSHGARRNQNVVKDILKSFMDDKIIFFMPTSFCKDFDKATNNQLFKLSLNCESEMFNYSSKYVRIEKNEFDKIIKIKNNSIYKIFNIFYRIKCYICMDDNCLHTCYPSIKTLCKACKCSHDTLFDILKFLYNSQLLFTYKLTDIEKNKINKDIDYIFSLENYSGESILNEYK